jgi:hypothetical protein
MARRFVQGPIGFEAANALVGALEIAISFSGPTITVHMSDLQLAVRPMAKGLPSETQATTQASSGTRPGALHQFPTVFRPHSDAIPLQSTLPLGWKGCSFAKPSDCSAVQKGPSWPT